MTRRQRIRDTLAGLAANPEPSVLDAGLLEADEWWLVKADDPCPCAGTGSVDVKFGSVVIDVRPCPRGCSIPR